jgi:nucleoside-diphosphate-sugar epimerase
MRAPFLVLGGNGFVGSAIVAEGRARGHEVLSVDKQEYDAAIGTACGVLINANGNSKKFLARENPGLEFDLSVRSVLRALHDFPAERVVHLSTMDIYPEVSDPRLNTEETSIDASRLSPYGFHKHLAEEIVRRYARHWIIFRMSGFVGKGLWKNSVFDLLNGGPLRVHPDSTYQYINTRDMGRIVFDMLEQRQGNDLFNVAGQGVISLRQVAGFIPGLNVDPAWNALPIEKYELNTRKLTRFLPLPDTESTVRDFVRDWKAGTLAAAPSPIRP